jgi:molecular chaperone DnaJ
MAKEDYYSLLGVEKGADKDAIKSAYRKLAMKYHPDRNPDDATAEQKFKEVNEAYDVLKDEQKRAAYDRFGHAAFDGTGGMGGFGGGRGPGGFGGFGGGDPSSAFSDIFDDLFGDFTGRRRSSAARGADLRYNMEIDLEEAFTGKNATIRVPSSVSCDECSGSGAAKGSEPQTCPTCGGAGKVRAQQGFFTIERTCPNCHGQGRIISNPCTSCSGSGRVQRDRTLNVNIPAGVEEGTRIRLAGEGEAGVRGGPQGDLYIFLSIKPHSIFERDGAHLHCTVPISMTTAALGGHVEVPTVSGGRTKVTIPAGTQSGRQFRLRGKGMPILRSKAHGDMYIEAKLETPVNLNKKQKELLEAFSKELTDANSPETQGFFSKVKGFWEAMKE